MATPLMRAAQSMKPCLADHASGVIAAGCDGLLLFGTTGEGTSFAAAERLSTCSRFCGTAFP
jgi:4-hydroxy-tetrahydrodipicolinate synthase